MIGNGYWAVGITCKWLPYRNAWSAGVEFLDDGFCSDNADAGEVSTEGSLHTRYYVDAGAETSGLTAAIDTILDDTRRLGIRFRTEGDGPALMVKGDGEDPDVELPPDWRDLLTAQSARLGWEPIYTRPAEAKP